MVIKRNQVEIIELKSKITEIELKRQVKRQNEGKRNRTGKLEDKSIEFWTAERKQIEKNVHSLREIYVFEVLEREEKEEGLKQVLNK